MDAAEEDSREKRAHGGDERTEEGEQKQKEEHNAEHQEEEQHKPLRKPSWGGTTEILGADKAWASRVINIAGNHDVGYAGDLDVSRIARFEKAFGSVNWDIWFTLSPDNKTTSTNAPPALRIVVLNSMNIDAPAWNHELQTETYEFMNHIITNSRDVSDKTHATILLTHIPLEKQPGVCVDSPLFNYFDDGQGLREQNMLSEHSSKTILQGLFGMSDNRLAAGQGFGRRGIILNGHDHEGCDTVHFIRQAGVNDQCDINTVKPEEAYWPAPTSTPTPEPTISIAPESYLTSPANPLANDSTCDLIVPDEPPPPPPPAPTTTGWRAHRFPHRPHSVTHDPLTNTTSCTAIDQSPHIREVTLRSMMGDFSGHAGFLSAWFDAARGERGEWVFEFASCGMGVQHWWWGVHSLDLAVLVVAVVAGVVRLFEGRSVGTGGDNNVKLNGKMSRI
ncbi:hypothetical protein BDU57DRAFT_516920 [Ampelomyces quisqualis]|uniref:Calcineurin-like phosphoesterase domain-containing protein n=1 Tax=Ampelomyces quisqualis TaxID=50730 RepID=A0A6A5QMK7_AMPQU|nr:hypothetical protein BDU57DRAFT_516920 [Ampelomyces quisqualis]